MAYILSPFVPFGQPFLTCISHIAFSCKRSLNTTGMHENAVIMEAFAKQ